MSLYFSESAVVGKRCLRLLSTRKDGTTLECVWRLSTKRELAVGRRECKVRDSFDSETQRVAERLVSDVKRQHKSELVRVH